MPSDAEFNEMKKMLSDALGRISVLEERLSAKNEKKLYRYFVPEYDAENKKIELAKKQDFLNVLQEESCKNNTGFTQYLGSGGYYPDDRDKKFDPNKIIREEIIIFDTYGKNPITPERLTSCEKYLCQNSLGIMSCDTYEFMYSNKI